MITSKAYHNRLVSFRQDLRDLSLAMASPVSTAKSAATDVTISVTTSAQPAKLQTQ
jgi:hypothetical protein